MQKQLEVPTDDSLTYDDYVSGGRACNAIDELLGFLTPVLDGTRRAGDKQGVSFIVGLMGDLGALREGLKGVLNESETTSYFR